MKNGVTAIILITLSVLVVFLFVQNNQLKKKLDEKVSEKVKDQSPAGPAVPKTKPANPVGASPFDKPNVDPVAERFPENSPGKLEITSIKFDHLSHNFGTIKEGDKVRTKFTFTNTGKVALNIAKAYGSCGCTVPTWRQDPVKPGETSEIGVEFDSNGKHGKTEKTVTVIANTEPQSTILTINAVVIPRNK